MKFTLHFRAPSNTARPCAPVAALVAALVALGSTACQQNPRASARAYLGRGNRYLAQKQYRRAAIEFRNALEQEPGDAVARYRLAQAENRMGEWHECYRDLIRVVRERPAFVPARLDLAEFYLVARQPVLASAEIRRARKLAPRDPRVAMLQMKLDLTSSRFHRALVDCAALRKFHGSDDRAPALCGLAYLGNKNYAAAQRAFRLALQIAPDSPENVRNLANLLDLEGKTARAESLVRAAVAQNPQSLRLALALADLYVRHGDLASADSLFAGLVRRASANLHLLVTLGNFWMWRNQLPRAIAEFRAAEALRPGTLIEKNLASAYLTLHDLPQAARYARAVLRRHPADHDALALEGALDALRGDYAHAVPFLESARKSNPSSLLANFYLGIVWQATGQMDRAGQAFGECVQQNDKFVQAYVRLGQIALESHDPALGAGYAKKILAVAPDSLDGYLLLAQADLMAGNLAAAGRIVAAAEKLPHPPQAFAAVAVRYYVLRKNFYAADGAFRQALAETSDPVRVAAWYAATLAAAGHTKRSIRRIQAALASSPHAASLHLLLARLDYDAGHLSRARGAARLALAEAAPAGPTRELLGEIDERAGLWPQAAAEYAAAIRADPRDAGSYLLAGDLLMRRGRYAAAERDFVAARVASPDSDPVKLALARCWAALGAHLDRALGLAQQLKSRYPKNPQVADALGWIYYRKAIYPLALDQLRFAARQLPQNATIEFHLAMALVAEGQRVAGRAALAHAISLHLAAPDATVARGVLATSARTASR